MRVLTVLTTLAVAATQPGGCAPTPKACSLDFAGITVQAGRVVDTVTVVCDLRPRRHLLQAVIQYKPFDTWDEYGRTWHTENIPGSGKDPDDLADRPVVLELSTTCSRGWYRTKVHTEGIGPATDAAPQGLPFQFEDTGFPEYLTAEDCAGGG